MALTDGKNIVVTPTTFDYQYRFDEDKGPGTGGMGCLSFENGLLPFLEKNDIDICSKLIEDTIRYINKDSIEFNGVIYGGFFKCKDGIKFIEFNARFGDPEAINVLNSLETPFCEILENIWQQNLTKENCKFKNKYIVTVYVVSPDYAIRKGEPCEFTLNTESIISKNAKIYFASCKKEKENTYISTGVSRLFAVCASGNTLDGACKTVYNAIEGNIDKKLNYRKDIGCIYEH